jgi:hypothetical protein
MNAALTVLRHALVGHSEIAVGLGVGSVIGEPQDAAAVLGVDAITLANGNAGEPDMTGTFAVTGMADLLGAKLQITVTFFALAGDPNDEVNCLITWTAPLPSWSPGEMYLSKPSRDSTGAAVLRSLRFSNARAIFSSRDLCGIAASALPPLPEWLAGNPPPAGLTVDGTLEITGDLPALLAKAGVPLGSVSARATVSHAGHVLTVAVGHEFGNDAPRLEPFGDALQAHATRVRIDVPIFGTLAVTPRMSIDFALVADKVELAVALDLDLGSDCARLTAAAVKGKEPTLDWFLGVVGLSGLPDLSVFDLGSLMLAEVTGTFDLATKRLVSYGAEITTSKPLKLFDGHLELQPRLVIEVETTDPPTKTVALIGDWKIGKTPLETYFDPGAGIVVARMATGYTLDLGGFLENRLPSYLTSDLQVIDLDIRGDRTAKTFSAELATAGGLAFSITESKKLAIEDVQIEVEYANGDFQVSGSGRVDVLGFVVDVAFAAGETKKVAFGIPEVDVGKLADFFLHEIGASADFGSFTLRDIGIAIEHPGGFSVGARLGDPIPIAGAWSIETAQFSASRSKEGGKRDVTRAAIEGTLKLAGADATLRADFDTAAGWHFQGSTGANQPIDLGQFLDGLANKLGFSIPGAVRDLTLHDIAVDYATKSADFTFACKGEFPILGQTIDFAVTVDGKKKSISATFTIDGNEIDVLFVGDTRQRKISARWSNPAQPLRLARLAERLGLDLSAVPDELLPAIESFELSYDAAAEVLVVAVETEKTSLAVVGKREGNNRVFAAAFSIGVHVDLGDLPVVGSNLAGLGVRGLTAIASSGNLSTEQVKTLNKALVDAIAAGDVKPTAADKLPRLPERNLDKAMLLVDVELGGQPHDPLLLRFAAPARAPAKTETKTGTPNLPTPAPSAPPQSGAWIEIAKGFGPLHVRRIGVNYREQRFWLMFDAGFSVAGLDIELDGLALGFKPKWPPDVEPALSGLGIGLDRQPLTISGGLVAVKRPDTPTEYNGQLLLKGVDFQLSALGSYTTVAGEASMFAFGLLDRPIGGPAFFYVTGVAAGFGFNRDLLIPEVGQLSQFPLVQAVMGGSPFAGKTDPAGAADVLRKYIPPRSGEIWVALGVRFTTFELLKSFALVTAKFGHELEIDLIGVSTAAFPTNAASPIAYAELGLKVSCRPDDGVLAITAQLTPASYVLSRDCHLTGGYAFYSWFKDVNEGPGVGARAGDFVVTAGGYHPAFRPPSWYPIVPRLGAFWQVNSHLSIKGEFYFALTPSALMAGAALDAVWESGDLRAWFSAHADFLLCWKPFHYNAEIGVSLGASFTVDLGITSFTVTVHVGVDLEFWGPSFAGRATVDLYICSLTITFGDSSPKLDPISWDDFKTSFLPSGKSQKLRSGLAFAAMAVTPEVMEDGYCIARVSRGLLRDLTREKVDTPETCDWIVQPELLELTSLSRFPTKVVKLTVGSREITIDGTWTKDFGVGPVGIKNEQFESLHEVKVTRADGNSIAAEDFQIDVKPAIANVPAAPWSADVALNADLKTINDNPATIKNALTGLVLRAKPPAGHKTDRTFDLQVLQWTKVRDPCLPPPFALTTPQAPVPTPAPADALKQFKATLAASRDLASAPGRTRAGLLGALRAQGLPVDATVDVTAMADRAEIVLQSAPVFSRLGGAAKAA